MRDKRISELKTKYNFYIIPTFDKNNLIKHTKKYIQNVDNDTLSMHSGGGYIAKSRLGSNYSKKRRGTAHRSRKYIRHSSKRSIRHNIRDKDKSQRFNEQLDSLSQK